MFFWPQNVFSFAMVPIEKYTLSPCKFSLSLPHLPLSLSLGEVCVSVCVFVCVRVCPCMCSCRGQRSMLSASSQEPSTLFFEMRYLRSSVRLGWQFPKPQGSSCLCLPVLGLQTRVTAPGSFKHRF